MSKKLKITHFGKYFPPEHGGIESVTAALANNHSEQGHDVNVVCFTKGKSEITESEHLTILRKKPFAIIASQPIGFGYFFQALKCSRTSDIIHIHTPNLVASLASLFSGKKTKRVVHWHADIFGKGILGKLAKHLELAMLRRADLIVCTTQNYATSSQLLRTFRSKIKVIPIGISELDNNTSSNPDIEATMSWVSDRPIILVVGRLVPYKGLFILLEAMTKVKIKAAVIVVGIGPLKEQLLQEIDRLNLNDTVRFVGRQSQQNLDALFARSDVFCLPSIDRAEAFGVVLLEAMRGGLPIIATNILGSGVSWVNQHEISGLNVECKNPIQLADALNHLLGDEQLKELYGKQAQQRFLNNFTQDKMSNKFLASYYELLS